MGLNSEANNIYIVASYNNTFVGWLIRSRAKLKFWNRYQGDGYCHISLSLDARLDRMLSFARKRLHNPLAAGLVQENIRTGMFARKPEKGEIAVFRVPVSSEQFRGIRHSMGQAWEKRDVLKYNFWGLFTMLAVGKGIAVPNRYFCSQWVAEVLNQNGLYFLGGVRPCHIRPFDIYIALKEYMIFEGCLTEYPLYDPEKEGQVNARANHASDIL